jgi:subtilisin family serine protease
MVAPCGRLAILGLIASSHRRVLRCRTVDATDKPFATANRGKYLALAAPGVDVLVPGVSKGIHFTTGTSVAAANVSGVVALLLERFPKLTPAQIRSVLTRTARKILPNEGRS